MSLVGTRVPGDIFNLAPDSSMFNVGEWINHRTASSAGLTLELDISVAGGTGSQSILDTTAPTRRLVDEVTLEESAKSVF